MPKLNPNLLKATFYLYETIEDARAGSKFGGTGFFVGYTDPNDPNQAYVYAVSNWHVAARGGASIIRVNKEGGGVDILPFEPHEWTFSPGKHDVAVADMTFSDVNTKGGKALFDLTYVDVDAFITQDWVRHHEIGPGDDIFMVGRFVDHDGGDSNVPSVRFGHISVMPQKVTQPTGGTEESYILDVHSRTGYSGSPVFVYRTPGSYFDGRSTSGNPANRFVKLLGIHWGQFPELWEIESTAESAAAAQSSAKSHHIVGLSGMTLAVPAWAILDLLEMRTFQEKRDVYFHKTESIARMKRRLSPRPEVARSKSEAAEAKAEPESDNPAHKEDFTSLLGRAATTKPKAD